MSRDVLIIIIGWSITIILLFLFVPKDKLRHANVIFFFKQLLTWILGLLVVQLNLIEYPVRSFPNATKTSFDFEYFIYPSFCVLFNLHYPEEKSKLKQFMYYVYYCSGLTIVETFIERYTNILEYLYWTWHITWISFFITFFISRQYYLWFFKLKEKN
jgi:hypothetical protein